MKNIINVNKDMLRICGDISNIAECEYDEIIRSSLTEREYEMLRLRYDEALTYQNIADMFGISASRVRQIMTHAECRKIPAAFRKHVYDKERVAWLKDHANETHTIGEWRLLRHQSELSPLNTRAIHALVKAGVDTVNDVVDLVSTDQFVGGHIKGIARNGVTYKLILDFVDKVKDQKDMPI